MKELFIVFLLLGLLGCSNLKGLISQRGEILLDYNDPQIELSTSQGSFTIDLISKSVEFNNDIIKFESFKVNFKNKSTGEVLFTNGEKWYKKLKNGTVIEITTVDVDNFIIFGIKAK